MTRINLGEQQLDGNTTNDSNTDSDQTVELDEQYHLRHSRTRNSFSTDSSEENSIHQKDCTEAIAKLQKLGHDARLRLERMKEQRARQQDELNLRNQSQAEKNNNFEYGDDDLRPKSAILKHKSEVLHQCTDTHLNIRTSAYEKRQSHVRTPSWFFNIPTTRTPFPEFESKLPPEETID